MPDAVTHPTNQELAAFGLGKLPERAAAVVAAHLDSCPACRKGVANVPPDSFLNKVRDARPHDSSIPPGLAGASSASRPAMPVVPCLDLPPELARHPKYLILRELGRGGMGVVYQARHKEMDRQVVIKVINRSLLDRSGTLERFHREVRAAALLSHPNIVTAYDAEQIGDAHMLVMEFVPGQSLAEVLQKKGSLPIAHACYYARQVALGLQHAHERNMVHRDIKPQNLILSLKNQVKILDFGLAKALREEVTGTGLTAHDACMGTPEYIAPEQAKDARSADIRADLYSLGCTLYCLLAGRPPFREDTWMNTVLAHIQKVPRPLPELRPEVSAKLWQVVERLMAKKPGQRYQKPIEVVQALVPFSKPGAKPDAKGGTMLTQSAGSPGKGTVIAADTGEIKKILRDMPAKIPPQRVPAKEEAASPFADLTDAGAAPQEVVRAVAKSSRKAWWKRPGVLAAAISVSLALILMAVIIIKVKVQTPNGDSGKELPPAPPEKPGDKDKERWKSLFNGKDLKGWKTRPEWEGYWHVENGALILSSRNRSELRTDRDYYGGFHLRAEIRIGHIQYAQLYFRGGYVIALNCINGNPRKTGSLFVPSRGWMTVSKSPVPPDQWFTLEVIAEGNHVAVKVNGQTTAEDEDSAGRFTHGPITLAGARNEGSLEYRKIEIKELRE